MSRTSLFLLGAALAAPALLPATPGPGGQPDDRELHVVALREGSADPQDGQGNGKGQATIKVDRPSKIVTLVLTAHKPVVWDLALTPQTRLAQVILGGYHAQSVRGLPKQADVIEAFHENRAGQQPIISYCHRIDAPEFRPMVRDIHDLTGLEAASFQGANRPDPGKPFVIDRVQTDPRLRSDYPRPTPAADLPKLEFRALELKPVLALRHQASYGDFTLTGGPKAQLLQPLPRGVTYLTVDPVTKKAYGLRPPLVMEVDLANNRAMKTDLGEGLPQDRYGGITFDTRRNRLLVIGFKCLCAYDPNAGKWSVLADLERGARFALIYHPGEDALFGLRESMPRGGGDGDVPILLERYDDKGAVTKKFQLGEPVFPGLVHYDPFTHTHVQLVAAGDYLVLIASRDVNRLGWPATEMYVFLIEPQTGKARLTWRYPER
jgi:hypothetical protein